MSACPPFLRRPTTANTPCLMSPYLWRKFPEFHTCWISTMSEVTDVMLASHASRNTFEMRVLLSNLPKSKNFRMALPSSSCVGRQRQSFTHRVNPSRVTSPVRKSDETIQIARHLGVGSFVIFVFFQDFLSYRQEEKVIRGAESKGKSTRNKGRNTKPPRMLKKRHARSEFEIKWLQALQ